MHLGILAHSTEGAALCFLAYCQEGFRRAGRNEHPDVTLDYIALGYSMSAWEAGEYAPIRATLATSVQRLAQAGAGFFACPDNTAHIALDQPGPDLAPRRARTGHHAFIMHNRCMALIQIRDVPEAVRDEIARKAAAAGQSMQAYLLGELTRLAERPSMAEITRRAQARARASGSTVTMQDVVAAVRASRDRREP